MRCQNLSLTLILLLILGWEWNIGAHPFETSTLLIKLLAQ